VGFKLGNAVGLEGGGILGAGGIALELIRRRNEVFCDIKVLLFSWGQLSWHLRQVLFAPSIFFVLLADFCDGRLKHFLRENAREGFSYTLRRCLLSPFLTHFFLV